jgi:hypothetical protein
MALLRLAALVALAVACSRAGAQPPPGPAVSGVTPPPGWTALPSLAAQVAMPGAEAWGDTARGCYAVWFRLQGTGASAEAVLAGLAAEQITTSDLVKPDGDGIVAATFAKGVYKGRLRARIADGAITALACFANQREPRSCEAPCTTVLGALP